MKEEWQQENYTPKIYRQYNNMMKECNTCSNILSEAREEKQEKLPSEILLNDKKKDGGVAEITSSTTTPTE